MWLCSKSCHCIRLWLPTRGEDCNLPLSNNNNNKLTHVPPVNPASEIFPWLFLSVALQCWKHWSLPDSNTQYTTSSHSVGGLWIVLRPDGSSVGNSFSVISESGTAKGPLSERKIHSLWALDWESAARQHRTQQSKRRGNILYRSGCWNRDINWQIRELQVKTRQ